MCHQQANVSNPARTVIAVSLMRQFAAQRQCLQLQFIINLSNNTAIESILTNSQDWWVKHKTENHTKHAYRWNKKVTQWWYVQKRILQTEEETFCGGNYNGKLFNASTKENKKKIKKKREKRVKNNKDNRSGWAARRELLWRSRDDTNFLVENLKIEKKKVPRVALHIAKRPRLSRVAHLMTGRLLGRVNRKLSCEGSVTYFSAFCLRRRRPEARKR